MPSGNCQPQSRSSAAPSATSANKRSIAPLSFSRYSGLRPHGYILGKTLGSGAYGKVKVAQCLTTNKQVAVKMISKKSAPKDYFTKFLPREVDVLKSVEHENVVSLHKVIETDDHTYLVMDMAENGDLLDYINSRRYLSEHMARSFFTDLVNGMDKCHKMNVVHRDLKCENLLLDSQLRLKIADFGFARKHTGKNLETYCGSFAYAAPQVILGDPYHGEKADIWSMGVILYAMVVGRLPFKDTDVKTMLSEIASRIVFPSRVSEEFKDLIKKILKFNPDDRLSLESIKAHPWMQVKDEKKAPTKDEKPKDLI